VLSPLWHNQHERNLNAPEKALRDKRFGLVFCSRPSSLNLCQNCAFCTIFGITSDFGLTGCV
ncbi:MAG: hypothetical protein AAAC49_01770, partial [Rhizobium leguminosarum]